jgi:hypothetical protein
MSWRPHPKHTITDPDSPRAWATCDRTGFLGNHDDLQWQYEWAGTSLVNQRRLVLTDYLDEPQRQLGTLILPPDPPSIMNARVENYTIDEEQSTRVTMDGSVRVLIGNINPPQRITIGE